MNMNELTKYLVESILREEAGVENIVVVYPGRFQPMHKGHYQLFKHLQKKFGKNVFIGTSDKTDNLKSPFNFKEKVMIMNKLHGVPTNKIKRVKNPYAPSEILNSFNPETTAFVTVVSEKDATRLSGKYFERYDDDKPLEGYRDKGYVYVAPLMAGGVSGTETRKELRNPDFEKAKEWAKRNAFTKWDERAFKVIVDKLKSVLEINKESYFIPKRYVERWFELGGDLVIENTTTQGKGVVDDGPNFLYPNFNTFNRVSKKRAEEIGYTLFSQIMSGELTDIDPHPIYPNGPVKAVTPYPAGVVGRVTATNQKDYKELEAYRKWLAHVTRAMALTGYSFVDDLDIDDYDSFSWEDAKQATRQNVDENRRIWEDLPTKTIDKKQFPNPTNQKGFLKKGTRDGSETDDILDVKNVNLSVAKLKPSQDAIYLGKTLAMAANGVEGGDLGAVISSDNHILDGHHRYAATTFNNPNGKVGGVKVGLTIGDLIPVLRSVGDAFKNPRGVAPSGGDVNIFKATIDDIKDVVYKGINVNKQFYNRDRMIKWFEGIGEEEIKRRLKILQSKKPPAAAPPRKDMPKIEPSQLNILKRLLGKGKIDVKPPYA